MLYYNWQGESDTDYTRDTVIKSTPQVDLKNKEKHKKGIDTINKMCYNIIVKRNGKEQNKKIKKVLKKS